MSTTLAASHYLVERVAVGHVEIKTQQGHPAVEELVALVGHRLHGNSVFGLNQAENYPFVH